MRRWNCAYSEKDIFDELFDVGWSLAVFADGDDELAGEFGGECNAQEFVSLVVKGQGANGDEADSHSERDEVDDEVEVIELHGGFDAEALAGQPGVELLACIGMFIDKEPILRVEPA